MRPYVFALLAAGQLGLAAQPALAAAPRAGEQVRIGAFAGAQVRIPLGGSRAEAPRASLGIAPVARSETPDGASRMRIGEGLQLRLQPERPVELAFGGTRLDKLGLTEGGATPEGEKAGVSTLGWVAIGVGTVVVLAGGFLIWLREATECGPGEC